MVNPAGLKSEAEVEEVVASAYVGPAKQSHRIALRLTSELLQCALLRNSAEFIPKFS